MTTINHTCFKSAFGWVGVAGSDRGVTRVIFGAPTQAIAVDRLLDSISVGEIVDTLNSALSKAVDLLARYFNGEPAGFDLDLDLEAGTAFQTDVWQVARQIPYGEVRSYSWIAQEVGKPKAARAVGGAMGANPLPIVVPCHRVIRSDGGLGGYSGGLHWKQKLLALERK